MDLKVATLTLEAFLFVFARTGGFMASAPLFSNRAINARIRVLVAACLAITMFVSMNDGNGIELPQYDSVLGFSLLIVEEILVGLALGFVTNLAMATLVMAGEFIDREIGFTMAQTFDPGTNMNVTITTQLYDQVVYLIILIANLHHFILKAIADSFVLAPVGRIMPDVSVLYTNFMSYVVQFFSIGFRIAMPVFLSTIILNSVLGILAKSSPQMNMFAVGMQLKVFAGLFVLSMCVMFIPNIANYLIERAMDMFYGFIGGM